MDFFKDFLNNFVYPLRIAFIVKKLKNHSSKSGNGESGNSSSEKEE